MYCLRPGGHAQINAVCFVKADFSLGRGFWGFAEDGHDRDGPLAVEGRLLSGHEVSWKEGVPGRLAGRLQASIVGAAAD